MSRYEILLISFTRLYHFKIVMLKTLTYVLLLINLIEKNKYVLLVYNNYYTD